MNNSSKLKQLKHIHKFDEKLMNIVTLISVLYIIFLIAELYLPRSKSAITFIVIIDTIICSIFLFEFFYLFVKAKNKWKYTKKNFLDLLASLPFLLIFGAFPQIALLNIFKMIRGFKNILKIYEYLRKKELSALAITIIVFLMTIIYFSVSIVYFERASNPAIQSFHDGLWWAVVTITTVGYGDAIPITLSGKVVAIIIMLFGVGLTSALSAIIVSFLLKPSQKKLQKEEKIIEAKEDLNLQRENLLLKNQKTAKDIEAKLFSKIDKLEKKIDDIAKKPKRKKH